MNTAELAKAEDLRQLLRTGRLDSLTVLSPFLASATAVPAAGRRPGEPAAKAGECVFLLAQALRAQRDPALAARLFQSLACAGRLGRAFACTFIHSRGLPLPQFASLLLTMPGRDFLAMLNDLLLNAPAEDKQLAAWLRSLLPAPGRIDLREALLFLKIMEPPLARPLRDALQAAGLGATLSKSFVGSPGPASAEALFQAVEALPLPDVQSAALAYALRTAGGGGPSRLGPLLAAPPDLDPRDTALASEMRRLALGPAAAPQLLAAASTEPETLGLVLADLLKSGGPHAATGLRLLPLLPRLGVLSCMEDLPAHMRMTVYGRILENIAALKPDFFIRCAKSLGSNLDQQSAQAVADMLAAPSPARDGQHPASPFNLQAWKSAPIRPVGPDPVPPKASKEKRATPAEIMSQPGAQLKDPDFRNATIADAVLLDSLTVNGGDLSRCRFSGAALRHVRISSARMAQTLFENCLFQGCVFSGVDLSHSLLNGCRFESCVFECCDLSRARFTSCAFMGCALSESSLAGGGMDKCRLDSVSFHACALSGMRLRECFLARLAFTLSGLSGGLWEKCICRDSLWLSCALSFWRLLDCECMGVTLSRSATAEMELLGGHTDNPHLAQARRSTHARLLESVLADPAPLAPALTEGAGALFVQACVDTFLRVDEAKGTLNAMRGQDQRRRELALGRLTEPQGQFLRLLPALLSTDAFEKAQGLLGVPACAISGHIRPGTMPRGAREGLERLFPGVIPTSKPMPTLYIEAVYAIGSLGSVAQKPSSDVDCWVCLGKLPGAEPKPNDLDKAGLGRKLAALEAWAWEQIGLELHFFLMDMEQVRQNDFGMSDKESSGSAQAALLKEEFYRTALKLAGRDLLWWAAPPTATQAEAETLLAELARFAPRTATELVDLGQPRPIPAEEFFGACLWQIVKALHSPYKSVMKLGLLEKYADQGRDLRLLCDRIKEAVLRGRKLLADVDPYLSLFTSIRKHYRQLGDATSLAIIGECLRLKTSVAQEDLPAEFDADSREQEAQPLRTARSGTFAAALTLGGMVNMFMVQAYLRIQEGIRAGGAARITPEDLTRLGRRIAANFSQQPHKVSLVPFLAEDLTFTELSFCAEKAPGKRTIWAVKGKSKASGKAAVESLAPIRRDHDVNRLLAWLLFNGLYDPRQVVLAEQSLAPIAIADLQNLLADLAAFFPRRATLEPDLDEYLRTERVVRCYLIANLPVPPDTSKIVTVSALYATNWGEVFSQTFDNPPPLLTKSPLSFLGEVLGKPIPHDLELKVFTPKRAICPRLKNA